MRFLFYLFLFLRILRGRTWEKRAVNLEETKEGGQTQREQNGETEGVGGGLVFVPEGRYGRVVTRDSFVAEQAVVAVHFVRRSWKRGRI